jgi:4-hydroxybenzoate polyprenyltransferase
MAGLLFRLLPVRFIGYAQLARLDRPIGTWLLFLPCFWGLAMASAQYHSYPPIGMIALFAFGALVMRGAGCTVNDIADRDIDAQVARTAQRPLPSGRVRLTQAIRFLIMQLLLGLLVLVQFNMLTVMLGIASLALVAIYPFMKRITYWPQFFLGLTFNWGALMGYSAVAGELSPAAWALYGAGIFWTLGYDTIYAHQDREDDALLGVKSSALRLGQATGRALIVFYAAMLGLLIMAGLWGHMSLLYWIGMVVTGWHLAMQIYQLDINRADVCLRLFRSNRDTGLIVGAAILLGTF